MLTITNATVNPNNSVTITGTDGPVTSWVDVVISELEAASQSGFTHEVTPLSSGTHTITVIGPHGTASVTVVVP